MNKREKIAFGVLVLSHVATYSMLGLIVADMGHGGLHNVEVIVLAVAGLVLTGCSTLAWFDAMNIDE